MPTGVITTKVNNTTRYICAQFERRLVLIMSSFSTDLYVLVVVWLSPGDGLRSQKRLCVPRSTSSASGLIDY